MTVNFRWARSDELEELIQLTGHSFPGVGRDHASWVRSYTDTPFGEGLEIVWVGEEGGRLVASCRLHRIAHWVSGQAIPAMGLGTVTIAPTHRQRGLAGEMVTSALRAAHERGDVLSSLYPFRASFYAKFGYGLAGDSHQYHILPASLHSYAERANVAMADVAEVAAFYEEWAAGQTGQLRRCERLWRELTTVPDRLLVSYRGAGGRVEGYALASYPVQLPAHERHLSVEELAWTTPEARRGLYGWLASMGDQWRGIALRVLPEHRFQDWLREPRLNAAPLPAWGLWFPSALLMRGTMFRVVDLEAAWAARRVAPDAELTLALSVRDGQLSANDGEWRLRLSGGRLEPSRGGGSADVRLILPVETLARIFMGALPPSAAVEAGLAEGEGTGRLAELDRALALPQSWTFDRY